MIVAVFAYSFIFLRSKSDLSILLQEKDLRGRFCGQNELQNKPYLYFLQPNIEFNLTICVEECPTKTGPEICIYDPEGKSENNFCYVQMSTLQRGKVCYPEEPSMRKRFYAKIESFNNISRQIIRDIYNSLDGFIIEPFFILLISIILFKLFRKKNKVQMVIYFSEFLLVIGCICLGVLMRIQYRKTIQEKCLFEIDRYYCGRPFSLIYIVCSYSFFSFAFLLILYFGYNFNKTKLIIALIKEMTEFTGFFNGISFLPFIYSLPFFALCVLLIYNLGLSLGFGKLTLISAKYIQGNQVKIWEYNMNYFYLVFCPSLIFYWLFLRILLNIVRMTFAFLLTKWYFSKKKHTIKLEVGNATEKIYLFHLGTVIYMSLIEIIFLPSKTILKIFVEKILSGRSIFNKFFQCIFFPIVFIHFKISRFIDSKSFVFVSLFGDSYSKSVQKTYFLLEKRNKSRNYGPLNLFKSVLDQVRAAFALLASILYLLRYTFISQNAFLNETKNIFYPFFVSIIIFFHTFFVLKIFRSSLIYLYEVMMICYFIDEEMYVTYQKFSEKYLKNFVPFFDIYGRKVEYYEPSQRIKSIIILIFRTTYQ